VVMIGSGQKFLTRVVSIFCGSGQVESGRVSHLWFGFEFGKFSQKTSNFLPSGQKKSLRVGSERTRVEGGSVSYLLRVKSKLGSGRVRPHLYLVGYMPEFHPSNSGSTPARGNSQNEKRSPNSLP